MLQGNTAGDYTSAATCPCHEQQQNTELAHPGCGNLCPRMDFAVPVGLKLSGFLRTPGAVWGEQRWQRPDLQELGCSIQSNLRYCHLSQLDVDAVLNMEIEENLL